MFGRKQLYSIELMAKRMKEDYIRNNLSSEDMQNEFEVKKVELEAEILSCKFKMEEYMKEWKLFASFTEHTSKEKSLYANDVLNKYYFEKEKLAQFQRDQIRVYGDSAEQKVLNSFSGKENYDPKYVQILAREARLQSQCNIIEGMQKNPIDVYLRLKLELISTRFEKENFEMEQKCYNLDENKTQDKLTFVRLSMEACKNRIQVYSNEILQCEAIINDKEASMLNLNAKAEKRAKIPFYQDYCELLHGKLLREENELYSIKVNEAIVEGEAAFEKALDPSLEDYANIPKMFLEEYMNLNSEHACYKKQCNYLESLEMLPAEVYFPKKIQKIQAECKLERLKYIMYFVDETTSDLRCNVIEKEADRLEIQKKIFLYEQELSYAPYLRCDRDAICNYLQSITVSLKKISSKYSELENELDNAIIRYRCGDDYAAIKQLVNKGLSND